MDGPYLLRHGERNGFVLLEFEVGGKDYKVYRSLEHKRSNITQKDGYIVEEGEKTEDPRRQDGAAQSRGIVSSSLLQHRRAIQNRTSREPG